MNCYFFRYAKKRNSTAFPQNSSGTNYPIQLKEETSILNPVITCARNDVRLFNYVYLPSYTRYYFIDDWIYLNGIWEGHLSLDVLASYKTDIGAMSCYIERSASNYDGTIIDTLYPGKTNFQNRLVSLSAPWINVAPSGGTYVIGIINGANTSRVGATTYYALAPFAFNNLVEALLSDTFIADMDIIDISDYMVKAFFNPIQYITSCMWFPFPVSAFIGSTPSENIHLGYWDTGVVGEVVVSLAQKTWVTGTIPDHPQISRGNYLNYSPYTRLTLYIPPFGSIPIDTSYLQAGRHLEAPVYIDHITGKADIFINFNSGNTAEEMVSICASRSAMFAVPIQLGQVIQDVLGAGAGAIGTVTSAITKSLGGVISGATSAISSLLPQESHMGVNGSFIQSIEDYKAVLQCVRIADEDLADYGRPCYKKLTINTLSGYVKCAESHPAIAGAFTEELDSISKFMTGGFFYE